MSRVKKCLSCGEILFCKKCGTRQSPEIPEWEQLNVQLTPDQKLKIEADAEAAGLSISEFVRRALGGARVTRTTRS